MMVVLIKIMNMKMMMKRRIKSLLLLYSVILTEYVAKEPRVCVSMYVSWGEWKEGKDERRRRRKRMAS